MNSRNEGTPWQGWALLIGIILAGVFGFVCILFMLFGASAAYGRYQAVQDAQNQIQINSMKIHQYEQLVQVEEQKKEIRRVEAEGIATAQQIINATLTELYLQHEAIKAQEAMANSPNHTTIYVPSGANGIPLVRNVGP